MNHRDLQRAYRDRKKKSHAETVDLMKEVFVCVSIPVVVFAFAYITLDTFARLFLG